MMLASYSLLAAKSLISALDSSLALKGGKITMKTIFFLPGPKIATRFFIKSKITKCNLAFSI